MTDNDFYNLAEVVKKLIGLNLANYKTAQMYRRLDNFITGQKVADVTAFCDLLQKDKNVVSLLNNFLTINVSEFFRDTKYFDTLRDVILPDLLRPNHSLSIWSAGCSNGAEAYSVAMLLENLSPWGNHRILGTDIDNMSLLKARAGGPYKAQDVKNIPDSMSKKYLAPVDGNYLIIDRIKRKVQFRYEDILKQTYAEEFDLIMCRNVVIYFTAETKRKLNQSFFRALRPGGILFIGGTETMLDAHIVGFERLSPCFFRKPDKTGNKACVAEQYTQSKR